MARWRLTQAAGPQRWAPLGSSATAYTTTLAATPSTSGAISHLGEGHMVQTKKAVQVQFRSNSFQTWEHNGRSSHERCKLRGGRAR